eukprot:TRINITY_DN2185_c0_g5_i3.p1 TRINITY_DN2185_c0_g5~~TRINITY_DN2185_c0_g5_i3.p1  ORF type:complete len:423 (+),score=130.70 TRINITY_DN2185_c0_g5_i3:127-1269(+)
MLRSLVGSEMCIRDSPMCCCLIVTHTAEVHVTERCGSRHRVLNPGISCLNPLCCEKVAASASLKNTMMVIPVEVKTLDDALVTMEVKLISCVKDFQEMHYSLLNPKAQKKAYVMDALRSQCSKLPVDQLFLDKDQVAQVVRRNVQEDLQPYGIDVISLLLTDIVVSPLLRTAMTSKEVARREIAVATNQAEGQKVRVVKKAEGSSDAEALAGSGTARERQALLDGVRLSINDFHRENPDVSPAECYDTVLLLQYLQALEKCGGDNETIYLPLGANSVEWLWNDLEQKKTLSRTKYCVTDTTAAEARMEALRRGRMEELTPPEQRDPVSEASDNGWHEEVVEGKQELVAASDQHAQSASTDNSWQEEDNQEEIVEDKVDAR